MKLTEQLMICYRNGNDYYEKTKKWLKNADLFNKKLWLIPVCQRYG